MNAGAASLTIVGATDVGCARDSNEDAFVVSEVATGRLLVPLEPTTVSLSPDPYLLMVCDGMGGAAAGEVAARLACEAVARGLFEEREIVRGFAGAPALLSALRLANQIIFEESQRRSDEHGMGTTCTAGLVWGERLIVGQVGDSRAYLFRAGVLRLLTRDQSLATEMLDMGVLSPSELKSFGHNNVILQALGVESHVDPVISEVELSSGDIVLICSDGLHGPVPDEKIADILRQTPALGTSAQALIQAALDAGGPDNVSVILATRTG